jgi:uncharacterized protein (TIGR02270 family)
MYKQTIVEVISQHADETAFLWDLRGKIIYDPYYSLADVAEFDNRIEANLDGLQIAGDAGWEICKDAFDQEDAGALFALAVLGFSNDKEDRIRVVLEAGAEAPELSREIVSALGWLSFAQVEKHIDCFMRANSPALRRIGITAAAIHRKDPGRLLGEVLTADDPLLQARALKAAGELGRADLLPQIFEHLESDDENCRFYAAWSAALLGVEARTVSVLREFVVSGSPYREKGLQMALRRMALPSANSWREELARSEETIRQAIVGAGIIGDSVAIPWLIEQMRNATLARVAAESFTTITGLDLDAERLDGNQPEDFEAGPDDDPEDEDVEMDPDESLPWPNQEGIHSWWKDNQANFQPGIRYLIGQPIKTAWLLLVLRTGYQRQRAAAAMELTRRQPGQPLFEVRAPGFRQKQLLGM